MYRVANMATQLAGVSSPKGDVQLKEMSKDSAPPCRPWTPLPNRCQERSLKAR